eukprot:3105756-Rhodomonas_salina.2
MQIARGPQPELIFPSAHAHSPLLTSSADLEAQLATSTLTAPSTLQSARLCNFKHSSWTLPSSRVLDVRGNLD